jgi:hypothetical protein
MVPVQAALLSIWKLHKELLEMRRCYLEVDYCVQIDSGEKPFQSKVAQLHPRVQRAFLRARLEELKNKAKEMTQETQ